MLANFKVCVRCKTYNHARYIEDAMNGFCIQQTEFPFVCIIVDDASADGEQEIIRNYMQHNFDLYNQELVMRKETDDYVFIYAKHKENLNCYFAVYLLKYNHYGINKAKTPYFSEFIKDIEFQAVCEGDDFWISPDKLQTQVTFLESHLDFSLCFHNVEVLTENEAKLGKNVYNHLEEKEYKGDDIIKRWTIPTCSVVYRSGILEYVPKNKDFCIGDNVLFLTAVSRGRCYCHNEKMGVYRRSINGWVANNSGNVESHYKMIKHMKALLLYFPQYKKGIDDDIALRYALITIYQLKECNLSFLKTIFIGLLHYHYFYIKHIVRRLIMIIQLRIKK